MPEVTLGDKTVVLERFSWDKGSRVGTLLHMLKQQVPEITKEYAEFRKTYAEDYPAELTRSQARLRFGDLVDRLSEEDWARDNQKFVIPGTPSPQETFFELAPLIYDKAEGILLRLFGLIVMDNETVTRYADQGGDVLWTRVDEIVKETIKPAPMDDVVEMFFVACQMIDGTLLGKFRSLGDKMVNAAAMFGWKIPRFEPSPISSETSEPQSTESASPSPSDTSGPLTSFVDSPTTPSEPSPISESRLTGTPS